MRLYIIRHPQTLGNINRLVSNPNEGNISSHGYKQIDEISKRLINTSVDRIYSSNSERCIPLAEKIQEYNLTKPELIISQSIAERNPGNLIGYSKKCLENLATDESPKNGESTIDVYNRASNFISYLIEQKIEKNLIVSHGFFLKNMIGYCMGLTPEQSTKSIKVSNCSLSIIDYIDGEHFRIEILNSKEHLRGL